MSCLSCKLMSVRTSAIQHGKKLLVKKCETKEGYDVYMVDDQHPMSRDTWVMWCEDICPECLE